MTSIVPRISMKPSAMIAYSRPSTAPFSSCVTSSAASTGRLPAVGGRVGHRLHLALGARARRGDLLGRQFRDEVDHVELLLHLLRLLGPRQVDHLSDEVIPFADDRRILAEVVLDDVTFQ